MKLSSEEIISFKIDHVDPLGQGVDKTSDRVTFIPKTLKGETGKAKIIKRSKGVQFARVIELETVSSHREKPACPHYHTCPGCHYLHTNYEHELKLKEQALERLLRPLSYVVPKIEVRESEDRFSYRNRIQLHYRNSSLGLIDSAYDEIVEIPSCKLIRKELEPSLHDIYQKEQISKKKTGHVELYFKNSKVQINWNKPYAEGGFTQVNEVMNNKLKARVSELASKAEPETILDLFSGDGNLSNQIKGPLKRTLVDVSPGKNLENYFQINLFKEKALDQFRSQTSLKFYDLMLVDPPRKGFPNLESWVKEVQPETIIYVSCKAATMVRDIKALEDSFQIENIILIDLFPSSHHFETLVKLVKKKAG